jgi:hypothetical protein
MEVGQGPNWGCSAKGGGGWNCFIIDGKEKDYNRYLSLAFDSQLLK